MTERLAASAEDRVGRDVGRDVGREAVLAWSLGCVKST